MLNTDNATDDEKRQAIKVENAIVTFVEKWQDHIDKRNKRLGYDWNTTLTIRHGSKNAKIVVEDHGQRSVAGFVDLSSGDVLRPASWRAPAKHARGNVLSEQNGMEAIDGYGFVKYLK